MNRLFLSAFFLFNLFYVSAQPDAEVINYDTDIVIRGNKLTRNYHIEIKINNRAGEEYATVLIPYSKLVRLSELKAFITDNHGNIIKKLDKSDITDKSSVSEISLYEDDFVKEFTLKHNSYPYLLTYSFQWQQDEFLEIIDWIPEIDNTVPTSKATLKIDVPKDYKLFFRSNLTDSYRKDDSGSSVIHTWTASYNNFIDNETLSPDIMDFLPRVIIVPEEFRYGYKGSFDSWLSLGNWHNDLMKGLQDLPYNEKEKILSLIKDVPDKELKIRELYKYLQENTRYINVTIKTGGFKPFPASYVAANKYGDCKALSNYFIAMLEVAGIKSSPVIVKAGSPAGIKKDFPSEQFNHMIVCVTLQNDTIWLDCTSKKPFAYLGTFTQGRDVLVIEKDRSRLVRTPALSPEAVLKTRKVRFRPGEAQFSEVAFEIRCRGGAYDYLFERRKELNNIQAFNDNFAEDGFEATDYKIIRDGTLSPEIAFSYNGKSSGVYKDYGNIYLVNILPFSLPKLENPSERRLPVQIDCPVYRIDTLLYEIPSGCKADTALPARNIESVFGKYAVKAFNEGSSIKVIKSYLLYAGKYGTEQYRDFYDFINKIITCENRNKIVVNKNN